MTSHGSTWGGCDLQKGKWCECGEYPVVAVVDPGDTLGTQSSKPCTRQCEYTTRFALTPRYIITKLCDTNKPRTEQPRTAFQSTGSSLLLLFTSKTGSMDGSSVSFGFEVNKRQLARQMG
ncbi:hypothetical protein MRX96_000059 [Rhipicephalus microplus]